MRHRVYCRHASDCLTRLDISVIRRAAYAALQCEKVDAPCEISVLITNDAGIQRLNRKYRNVDSVTDVLSFPQYELKPGAFTAPAPALDANEGAFILGDIVLSAERVDAQAAELGHTAGRETAYLTVHSVLHLLGYDHTDEGAEKRLMRAREKEIMRQMGGA
ncbi:MAG: rRNA maturation RNase YbeY [Oscillospiraceae bacterium]|jgi:probable rRNA maturation factor|nr:rRNA maturation RNase YbeY [Oscillospiraceae bacterium]